MVAGSFLSELGKPVVMAESLCHRLERLCGDGGASGRGTERGERSPGAGRPSARPSEGPGGRAFPSAVGTSARSQYRSFSNLFSF